MKTVEEIKRHLRIGDLKKVAETTGLSYDNVLKTLSRPKAKRHQTVFNEAKKIAVFNKSIGL